VRVPVAVDAVMVAVVATAVTTTTDA
jgi:hypothetical protein